MEATLFLRRWTRRRMAANALGIILFEYAGWLQRQGYSRNTIHQYTQAIEHFGFWRATAHPSSQNPAPSEAEEFLEKHLRRCNCPQPAVRARTTCRAALQRLLTMLGKGAPRPEEAGPARALLVRFDLYLDTVCGLSAATRSYRWRYAREFLAWRFNGRRPDGSRLGFADFMGYVTFRAPQLKPASLGVMISSLRSLVRFLELERQCAPGLSEAWPTVPNWKPSPPPGVLTRRQCRDLLRAVDASLAAGRRDMAIVRLMLDLGLRCSEVAALSLDDFDWHAGTLAVRKTKQRRERLLPLPPILGRVIARYLRAGRPESSSRRLLLCHRLPVGQPMTKERVRGAVRRALQRIGLTSGATHRLRHTFATHLHTRGASLKQLADILGHQHFDTSAVYARVNLRQLRKVALPWPGVPLS